MADAFLNGVATTLGSSLASYAQEQLLLSWGLDSEVQKLKRTVDSINAFLRDVEERPGGIIKHADQDWLSKLRDIVCAADDVFDEIVTRAERKRLAEGNAFAREVKFFFSSSNQVLTSFSLAQRIKSIRESLDEIYDTRQKLGGNTINLSIGKAVQAERRNLSDNVVGRDSEKDEIIKMLLDLSPEENVSILPIVGVGGLGKSTLARYVFNDEQVKSNFDLHLWVSLPEVIDFRGFMEEIIAVCEESSKEDNNTATSAPSEQRDCVQRTNYELDQLKIRLSGLIKGKKYILVLDNVWNMNALEWRHRESVLTSGAAHGSRILLTTRDLNIARITGTIEPYQLQPLNGDNSWSLLESIVFGKKGCHDSNLKEIGSEILSMCNNIPLGIQALAGVLAENVSVGFWSSFRHDSLSDVALRGTGFDIIPILKVSYDHLHPSKLKSCFLYCSLFPKGYVFKKNKLVRRWIAQGFIERLHNSSSLEAEGAECLNILINKGLLKHVPTDESHHTWQLHDLMYDLSRSVAAGHCKMLSSSEYDDDDVVKSIYHVSIQQKDDSRWSLSSSLQSAKQLRTFLWIRNPGIKTQEMSTLLCESLMSSFRCLRVLDLSWLKIKKLPKSLGKLIHLRYLDLSGNDFKTLPNSITLLQNLQYLDLSLCWNLIELPKDMRKLVNMRHVYLNSAWKLSYFGSGLRHLTNLQTLPKFYVGVADELKKKLRCISRNKSDYSRLSDLKSLNDLRGSLSIIIKGSYQNMALDAREANLKGKKNLIFLSLRWSSGYCDDDELVFENLQPHNGISGLYIDGYGGRKLPTWMATNQLVCCLQHLKSLTFWRCNGLVNIPSFSQLPNLKSLTLWYLDQMEYMGSGNENEDPSPSLLPSPTVFFPSLTKIEIHNLPNFKGWRERAVGDLSFPCVSEVEISRCEKLESMPSCPNAEELRMYRVGNVQILRDGGTSSSSSSSVPKLKSLQVDSVDYLASLPRMCLANVSELSLKAVNVVDVSKLGKSLEGMTSLKYLELWGHGFTSDSGLPVEVSTLERLEFEVCHDVPFLSNEDASENALQVLKNLRYLKLDSGILAALPPGIRHLTTLQSLMLSWYGNLEAIPGWIGDFCSLSRLEISHCPKLTSLPQEMTRLRELKLLVVEGCPELERKCKRDTGEDWHKIQHVKEIIIG